ncbi:hypothetical protein [Serratia marcescens]|uniref:hypothetical protein n=1 Tax=Serratia marcescens TaxID=615 RepID=UPI000AFBE6EE|nr:hypothetical protein [Serratia marcescens]
MEVMIMHIDEFLCNKGRPKEISMTGRRGKGGILTKSGRDEYALLATENRPAVVNKMLLK